MVVMKVYGTTYGPEIKIIVFLGAASKVMERKVK